jgi:hypothetical protein
MFSYRLTRNFAFVFGFFLLQTLNPQPATAQMDWLKVGKELLGTSSNTQQSTSTTGLTNSEVANGLKDALRVGTETVVGQLGQRDGFNTDPTIHIPLPASMQGVKTALSSIGMSTLMDDLELKLNRAAEEATPQAKKLFWDSIEAMTLDDVMGIYNGPEDSATRYFQGKMSDPLAAAMKPIVEKTLNQVGAVQAYDAVMGKYASMPFVPDVKANLQAHVIDKGMAGIFHYLAAEEAAIRKDPLKQTTEILQKVFGSE